jgi:hypothetical protein
VSPTTAIRGPNSLVAGSWERTDGTGIQVQPELTGDPEVLAIKVTCTRG